MTESREDRLQSLVQSITSVMRHGRHPMPPGGIMLSPHQGDLLFIIAHHPDGISVKELAEHTAVTPGAITQIIDTLVEKGLVTREGDSADRRVVRLKVTKLAREQADKFRQEMMASFIKVFEVLNDEEITQLTELMKKVESSQNGNDKFNA